jgi:predicted nucleic acid-binding protein
LIAYADTSFLASLYGKDANSAHATRQTDKARPVLIITPLAELEFITAFEAIAFRERQKASEIDASMQAFRADLAMGVLKRRPIPENAFAQAILLSKFYTRSVGCRTLDILQVAIALELEAELFFTFNKEQAKLAKRAGLNFLPAR